MKFPQTRHLTTTLFFQFIFHKCCVIHSTEQCQWMQSLPRGFLSKSQQKNQYWGGLDPYVCLSVFPSGSVGMRECAHKLLRVQAAKYSDTFICIVQTTQIESPAVFISLSRRHVVSRDGIFINIPH